MANYQIPQIDRWPPFDYTFSVTVNIKCVKSKITTNIFLHNNEWK